MYPSNAYAWFGLADPLNLVQLNEDSKEWMDRTLAFYDAMRWDLTVGNDDAPVGDDASRMTATLGAASYYPCLFVHLVHHPRV